MAHALRCCLLGALLFFGVLGAETVGKRPYEMEWAGRVTDDHAPLIDFESNEQWTVSAHNATASFARSREQQLWGDYVYKLSYQGSKKATPTITLTPPQPLPLPEHFDTAGCWIYGNNWGWVRDRSTPQVLIRLLLQSADGERISLPLARVDWKEWFLPLVRLRPDQISKLRQPGACFVGIEISNCSNTAERVLYFDNLQFFLDEHKPLSFEPRPERNLTLFPGQDPGANRGPGRLPFPTREETIWPDNAAPGAKTSIDKSADGYTFRYEGPDGVLEYTYRPSSGSWSDISAQWSDRPAIRPLEDGGLRLFSSDNPGGGVPEQAELLSCESTADAVTARWRLRRGELSVELTQVLRLWGKSLVLDSIAPGGAVAAVVYGQVSGLSDARSVTLPYYDYGRSRPALVVSGSSDSTRLFVSAHTDWYRSQGSRPYGIGKVPAGTAAANGGVDYLAKTDGQRNDCFERFFITVSPQVEDHLPTIANPPSPYKHISGRKLWRSHGASGKRERDYRYWYDITRHGMSELLVSDHEVGWRDGGESFTFRTRAAPAKGGDEGWRKYSRYMQDDLGIVYGLYNNFTDFAPVNEFWSTDMVTRSHDNQLLRAWMRCYAPKPLRAVEFCARQAPVIQQKFAFNAGYCDVHSCVTPAERTDFDHRVPGAGSFAQTYYAFGEIMLHQKKAWGGPVFSEGGQHCFYSGLTDGNYAQDQRYNLNRNPWIVDFDLRRMHDLECNFGVGRPDMFYGRNASLGNSDDEIDSNVDRFLCATLAFGHPAYLLRASGMRWTIRTYFMLQQLQARYTQASIVDINYADADGRLWDLSAALLNRAYERNQIALRYDDGSCVVVNGHRSEALNLHFAGRELRLPPHGYAGWTDDGSIEVLSTTRDGKRYDYAATPEYVFLDSRQSGFIEQALAASNGAALCRRLDDSRWEIIPYDAADCAFAIEASSARAIDFDGKDLGPAELRRARGLTTVMPVAGAFSYHLNVAPGSKPHSSAQGDRLPRVFPGQSLQVDGQELHIPSDAPYNTRYWQQRADGSWLDYSICQSLEISARIDDERLVLELTAVPYELEQSALLRAWGQERSADFSSGTRRQLVSFELPDSLAQPGLHPVAVHYTRFGEHVWDGGIIAAHKPRPYGYDFRKDYRVGMQLRGEEASFHLGTSGALSKAQPVSCGGIEKNGFFVHPPWKGGSGQVFMLYKLSVPASEDVAFRARVGKIDGSSYGDGTVFKITLIDSDGKEQQLAEQVADKYQWEDIQADLAPWAGQDVDLKIICDIGPADNSQGDWSALADLRLETRQKHFFYTLDPIQQRYAFSKTAGAAPWSASKGARIAKAWLCYQAQGFNSSVDSMPSFGILNGQDIGMLIGASGNEKQNIWSEEVRVPINSEAAIRSIDANNIFVIDNREGDCCKLCNFRLELELGDGSRLSSQLSTAIFSQPPSWAHAEGIRVPADQSITVPIVFR
jgi:hypothetical protein